MPAETHYEKVVVNVEFAAAPSEILAGDLPSFGFHMIEFEQPVPASQVVEAAIDIFHDKMPLAFPEQANIKVLTTSLEEIPRPGAPTAGDIEDPHDGSVRQLVNR